jgi:hypothetical protein
VSYAWCAECQHVRKSNVHCPMIEVPMSDPRPHDFIHGHEPGGSYTPADWQAIHEHNVKVQFDAISDALAAILLAVKSLENRMERVEARLAVVERATPLRRPKRT